MNITEARTIIGNAFIAGLIDSQTAARAQDAVGRRMSGADRASIIYNRFGL